MFMCELQLRPIHSTSDQRTFSPRSAAKFPLFWADVTFLNLMRHSRLITTHTVPILFISVILIDELICDSRRKNSNKSESSALDAFAASRAEPTVWSRGLVIHSTFYVNSTDFLSDVFQRNRVVVADTFRSLCDFETTLWLGMLPLWNELLVCPFEMNQSNVSEKGPFNHKTGHCRWNTDMRQ